MSKKPLIKRKFKITMVVLLIGSILSFITSISILYCSDYKLSNYKSYFKDLGYSLNDFLTNGEFYLDGVKYTKTEYYDIFQKDVESINFNSDNYDVQVHSTNEPNLKVFFNAKGLSDKGNPLTESTWDFNYDEKSKNLNIKLNPVIDKDFLNASSNYDIDIYVPTKYKNNLDISSSSGNINLSSNNLSVINLKSSSGNIDSYSSNSKTLNIDSNSGNLTINNDINTLNANTKSGHISLSNSIINRSTIKTDSGNIDIRSQGVNNSLLAESSSGNIDLSFYNSNTADNCFLTAESKSGNIATQSNTFLNSPYTNGKGNIKINLKSNSGNITLPF